MSSAGFVLRGHRCVGIGVCTQWAHIPHTMCTHCPLVLIATGKSWPTTSLPPVCYGHCWHPAVTCCIVTTYFSLEIVCCINWSAFMFWCRAQLFHILGCCCIRCITCQAVHADIHFVFRIVAVIRIFLFLFLKYSSNMNIVLCSQCHLQPSVA